MSKGDEDVPEMVSGGCVSILRTTRWARWCGRMIRLRMVIINTCTLCMTRYKTHLKKVAVIITL
jgi:hypothetical protein